MKLVKKIFLCAAVALVGACGGGGGDPGTPGGGGANQPLGTLSVQLYKSDEPAAVNTFKTSDLDIHAKAVLKDKSGQPVPNAIVTFSENGSGLLTFMPESATALTNSSGIAEVDLKATGATSLGATQVVATASLNDRNGTPVEMTGSANLSVTAAVVADPQSVARAINFTAANPADRSIVIAGSGGTGRSETALLTFTVVDAQGAPIKGVIVDFNAVPADSVVLSTPEGKTNSEGQVVASVSSKSRPTSVVINAQVRGRPISTQSDTLTVTTDVATQRGFDLSASKFNLDYDLSGDSSTINVRIVDRNGNPVTDGVAVVARTDFGRVGSASRGGCTTANGKCSVDYEVQNPRPADGVPVTVVFSTQTGQGTEISDSLNLWVTSVGWLNLYESRTAATPFLGPVSLQRTDPETCKFGTFALWVGTPKGFAAPAGTTISARSRTDLAAPTIVAGSPTLDRASSRTLVEFSATGKEGNPAGVDTWVVQFAAGPSKTLHAVELALNVPACPKKQ
ncbi:hypothetical protein C6568_04425 [Melaminivora suipulveris]|uniref:Big-1 domain-containing protein n=1 Tax=Melaminivora suipulveris TaxID=2109913 RepID=A0A2R3Q9Z2_9BURK|nr:Ig-like domain-containing protein [Melaminivora suipulveris]AVO48598.1 hypothetical protein C6568_04425 [Melaminivora suipulveris]